MSLSKEELYGEDGPFNLCPDCNTPYVRGAAHRCNKVSRSPKTRAERVARQKLDTGDPDALVAVVSRRADAAYHALDGDGIIKCLESHRFDVNGDPHTYTRRHAKLRGNFPCSECFDLLEGDGDE